MFYLKFRLVTLFGLLQVLCKANGEAISSDNSITKVPFHGRSVSIWRKNNSYLIMPMVFLNMDKIGYINSSKQSGKELQFQIIFMTKDARVTVLNHLRNLMNECVKIEQIEMVPINTMSIILVSPPNSGFHLKKAWNVSLISNPDKLTLSFACQNMMTCGLFHSILQSNPKIEVQFNVTGSYFEMEAKVVNMTKGKDATDIKETQCKSPIEIYVSKLAKDVGIIKQTLQNQTQNLKLAKDVAIIKQLLQKSPVGPGCINVQSRGIYSDSETGKELYCKSGARNEIWTVIMSREDGSVNFSRPWIDYKNGFGYVDGEFWLGNEYVYKMVKWKTSKLRFEVWDEHGQYMFSELENFKLGFESTKYQISWDDSHGNITEMSTGFTKCTFNSMKFTTLDNDNDNRSENNCAKQFRGGWCFKNCFLICPTCKYENKLFNHQANTPKLKRVLLMIR